jgi:uncharacterized protein
MAMLDEIEVFVVYALEDRQTLLTLRVPAGTSALQLINRSGIRQHHPEIPMTPTLGIFGRVVSSETPLNPGDRVEVLRPLAADPKETRRRLAREGRTMARTVAPAKGRR